MPAKIVFKFHSENLGRGTQKVGDWEEEAKRRTGVQTATALVRPMSALVFVKASLLKSLRV